MKQNRTIGVRRSCVRGRLGFTLVELLVVVTIITMLVGLMLVGVNSARESARRATCLNNQKQLGTAIQSFAASKERLPGMVEKLTRSELSWCHLLLPYVGENKRYENAIKYAGNVEGKIPGTTSGLAIFVCSSSQRVATVPNLTYAVNAGPAHITAAALQSGSNVVYPPAYVGMDTSTPPKPKYDFAKLCLFIDRRDSNYTGLRTHGKLDTESFPDGLTNTILLTENVQGGTWADKDTGATTVDPTYTATPPAPPTLADQIARAKADIGNFGFLWGLSKSEGTTAPSTYIGVNSGFAQVADDEKNNRITFGRADYARPSSRHPGIVQILMADGSVQSLSDDVDQNVYTAMLCPDDKLATKPLPTATTTGGLGWVDGWWTQK